MKLIDKIRVRLFGWHHWKITLEYKSIYAPFTLDRYIISANPKGINNHRALKKVFCDVPLHKMKGVNKELLDNNKLTVSNVQYLGRW